MKEPGYYFYVNNWIAATVHLTLEQKGAYKELLNLQFLRGPFTLRQAELILQGKNNFDRNWPFIYDKFVEVREPDKEPVYYNERMKHDQDLKKYRSEAGKKGMKSRYDNKPDNKPDNKKDNIDTDIDIDIDIRSLKMNTDNEIWKMFITGFNEITGRKFSGDQKARRQFFARLKQGYTPEQFGLAIVNCFNDKFHVENPMYLTPEFITRQDKLEKYLNYKASPTERDRARDIILKYFNQLDNEQTSED
jgi:uncharacterized phage protein (TIGR02220 family)